MERVAIATRFYEIILTRCGNPIVGELLQVLHARINFLRAGTMSILGRPLASLREMRAMLDAVATGIREALLRLQEQNLVEVRPRSGYRVRPVSAAEVNEMYEMRLLYERACVKGAIARASEADIDRLAQHLTTDAHMFAPDWIALNRAFHAELALISGNSHLASATNKLTDQFDRFTRLSVNRLPQPVDFSRFNNEHAAIVASIRARNKKAAMTLVRAYIEASRERTIQILTDETN